MATHTNTVFLTILTVARIQISCTTFQQGIEEMDRLDGPLCSDLRNYLSISLCTYTLLKCGAIIKYTTYCKLQHVLTDMIDRSESMIILTVWLIFRYLYCHVYVLFTELKIPAENKYH